MSEKSKIPASSFPKIPTKLLFRIVEEWELPRKNQSLPRRSLDARKLAMRLRTTQAALRNQSTGTAADSDTWQNVMDYLTGAMKQNDFKTLEAFCEGFVEFAACSEVVAKGDLGLLQSLQNNNDPASGQIIAIIRAILVLQHQKGFPPYQSEIIEYLNHRRGDDWQNISNGKLSSILQNLEIRDLLPKKGINP